MAMGFVTVVNQAVAVSGNEQSLGHYPLCEASSAMIVACPDGKGDCLLVGDNEQRNEIFLFKLKEGKIDMESQQSLSLQPANSKELSDIEAIAAKSADTVVVLGSHSRNTRCERKKNRRRFAVVTLSGDGSKVVKYVQSKKITCKRLFGRIPSSDKVLNAVCDAIDDAEKRAAKVENEVNDQQLTVEQAKASCNEASPFNAEGAVAIPVSGSTEFWIGLRAPLLGEHPTSPQHNKLAILLRMKGLHDYSFDRVALLNLEGRGVRDLAFAEDRVWLITGPSEDLEGPFDLRSFSKDALKNAEIIKPEFVTDLPMYSEGLAIQGKRAYVVIDGDKGYDEATQNCKSPSKYRIISLP